MPEKSEVEEYRCEELCMVLESMERVISELRTAVSERMGEYPTLGSLKQAWSRPGSLHPIQPPPPQVFKLCQVLRPKGPRSVPIIKRECVGLIEVNGWDVMRGSVGELRRRFDLLEEAFSLLDP